MTDAWTSLQVNRLGKAFRAYRSEWQRFASWFGIQSTPLSEHWVVRDVSFSVARGEAVGIVGVNGAGKSTLLKLIVGTLQASAGSVAVDGKIAALLELGMGFSGESTGRENALHAAGLMGRQASEIEQALPAIQAFADIGTYFDEPVRTYSSGMQLRLAFAVATAFRPDVLIIDEALAVGDAAFQRKCFQRIEAFRSSGTTLLLVSHDVETIKKICTRAILLHEGGVRLIGAANRVCDEYERMLFGGSGAPAQGSGVLSRFDPALAASSCEIVYGNGDAEIESYWVEDRRGTRANVIVAGEPFSWCYSVRFIKSVADPIFAMMVKTREGVTVYGADSSGNFLGPYREDQRVNVRFDLDNVLAPGVYFLNCGVRVGAGEDTEFLCRRVDAIVLRIVGGAGTTAKVGLLDLQSRMSLSAPAPAVA